MKIETRYNIGDEVWHMKYNKCVSSEVEGIRITCIDGNFLGYLNHFTVDYCLVGEGLHDESSLFPTKEELLKSL